MIEKQKKKKKERKEKKSVPEELNGVFDRWRRPETGRRLVRIGDHCRIWPIFRLSEEAKLAVRRATQLDPAMEAMSVPKMLREAKMEEEKEARE